MTGVEIRHLHVNGVRYAVRESGLGEPVVLLHGFTGSSASLAGLMAALSEQYHVFAPDLLGHGDTDAPQDWQRYSMEHTIRDLESLLDALDVPATALMGYSMGGRIALSFTCEFPRRITSLILESASPGLLQAQERAERRQSDWALSAQLMAHGLESFVERWQSLPLFENHWHINPQAAAQEQHIRLSQRADGLAASLKGCGTGSQRPRWDALSKLDLPVLLVTGKSDSKFENIASQMSQILPHAQHVSVSNAGHTVHLEQPRVFETNVIEFLRTSALRNQTRLQIP